MATLVKDYESDGVLHFVLKDIHVSEMNAIRRTILSKIPLVVIRSETEEVNDVNISTNTTRFHNEILKQRLSSIPVFTTDKSFVDKYKLVLDVKNNTNEILWVTTNDFLIQEKESDIFLPKEETNKIFPLDTITYRPIDFVRLRPELDATIPGEHISLTANFSISTAEENGMFNAVSKCSFHNVIDAETRENIWALKLQTLKNENRTEKDIEFEKKNFDCLDANRCYKIDENGEPNEFEMVVQTLGIYSNYKIVFMSCDYLERLFQTFIERIRSGTVPIHESTASRELGYTSVIVPSIENCYDIILENEDYTFGYLLEVYLYKLFYTDNDHDSLTYIGFKKFHPHDTFSVIRMAFKLNTNANLLISQYLIQACNAISKNMNTIKKKFDR